MQVRKKHTTEMLADFLTKPTSDAVIRKCMAGLGFDVLDGRHDLAYKTA